MMHRARCIIPHALSVCLYSSMFFRKSTTTGHVFFCAPLAVVQAYFGRRAAKLHLPTEPLPLASRDVFGQGALNRLMAYERLTERTRRGLPMHSMLLLSIGRIVGRPQITA